MTLVQKYWLNYWHYLLEENNLIPESQHGFRGPGFMSKRSAMSAWAERQHDWAQNSEEKQITGLLLLNKLVHQMEMK